MNWNQLYTKAVQPSPEEIAAFVGSPLWGELGAYIADAYGAEPRVEHSVCSGAPGWNVKYKKGSRALCTLYPDDGSFTCLLVVGTAEAPFADAALAACSDYVRELYANTRVFNGTRWLMLRVADARVLEDVKTLLSLRAAPKK